MSGTIYWVTLDRGRTDCQVWSLSGTTMAFVGTVAFTSIADQDSLVPCTANPAFFYTCGIDAEGVSHEPEIVGIDADGAKAMSMLLDDAVFGDMRWLNSLAKTRFRFHPTLIEGLDSGS